ncbi:uncharacterized protein BCR38DRAFT_24112 [Pseudomassariella vexata]|uniref:Uncharacterized protein n=1 Tax=Pseudomassariella vexata TaxID=1141098 RepID=A0A1Y2EK85_9PEZI|nr:uncharacterized protein BCR38DRAFT_24112 [Pseudomassariella vexata]ORY71947.1 hypothetical protein BCR38DRAFT_24112 [Pseudomassariella vexata]
MSCRCKTQLRVIGLLTSRGGCLLYIPHRESCRRDKCQLTHSCVYRHSQSYPIDANVFALAEIKHEPVAGRPDLKRSFCTSLSIRESVEVTFSPDASRCDGQVVVDLVVCCHGRLGRAYAFSKQDITNLPTQVYTHLTWPSTSNISTCFQLKQELLLGMIAFQKSF